MLIRDYSGIIRKEIYILATNSDKASKLSETNHVLDMNSTKYNIMDRQQAKFFSSS
jgi:hypothetical protein